MIEIFDDIISREDQEQIKSCLLGRDFSWYYLSDVTHLKDGQQQRPGFSHYFVLNEKVNSDWNHLTNDIIKNSCKKVNIDYNKVLETRAFLQLPLHYNITKGNLIDTPHRDRETEHTVILYYVNTIDGDTIIYENGKEKKRVTPKQGRVIIFNGLLYHTGSQPVNGSRCIINVNIL